MKNKKEKMLSIMIIVISIILLSFSTYAHSGRTDASGGHKDKNNVSGLGSYHYHCGGHPAHLHTNGVCPYSSSSSSSSTKSSSSSSSSTSSNKSTSSNTKTTTTNSTTIEVSSIVIDEKIEEMKVGEIKQLTTSMLPDNATDKSVIWKSSDESIITTSESGKITAKRVGETNITVTTSNGKNDTIKIKVIEEKKEENTAIIKTSTIQNSINNEVDNNSGSTNPVAGIITIGLLGGGGYWGYKKYKNKK